MGSTTSYCRMDSGGTIYGPDPCATGYVGMGRCQVTYNCNSHETCGPPAGQSCTMGIMGVCQTAPTNGLEGCLENVDGCVQGCRGNPAFAGTCWMP